MNNISVATLKKLTLFESIDPTCIEQELKAGRIYKTSYLPESQVHKKADTCTSFDYVLSGTVQAAHLSPNGSITTVSNFGKDSFIGANFLFGKENSYILDIICKKKAVLLHIEKAAVLEFLHDYNFTLIYVKSISSNAQIINQKLGMLSQKSLRTNLINFLQQEATRQASPEIVLEISKKDLADYLGVKRQSLFREFKNLKEEKLITSNSKKIVLSEKLLKTLI